MTTTTPDTTWTRHGHWFGDLVGMADGARHIQVKPGPFYCDGPAAGGCRECANDVHAWKMRNDPQYRSTAMFLADLFARGSAGIQAPEATEPPPATVSDGAPLDDVADWVERFRAAKEAERAAKAIADEARDILLERIGKRAYGTVAGRPVIRVWRGIRRQFLQKRFVTENPELAERYTEDRDAERVTIV